jgi:hypothetical protein
LERDTSFARRDGLIGSTRLGNILNASAAAVFDRYGIDMSALWPQLEASVPEDATILKRVGQERSNLDFHLALVMALYVFAAEYFALSLWQGRWVPALAAVLFVGVGYLVYVSGLGPARAWADAQEVLVDLHREDLRKALGLGPFFSLDAERQAWQAISAWALWGDAPPAGVLTYAAPPSAGPTPALAPVVVCSPNVVAQVAQATPGVFRMPESGAAPLVTLYQHIDYVVLIAAAGDPVADRAWGIYLVVQDPRARRIDAEPVADDPFFTAHILRTDADTATDALLWTGSHLPSAGARALRYTLDLGPLFQVSVTHPGQTQQSPALAVAEVIEHIGTRGWLYTFNLTASQDVHGARLAVVDRRLEVGSPPTANFRWDDTDRDLIDGELDADGSGYAWPLPDIGTGSGVLTFVWVT